jgi:hypothetical protein
VKINGSKWLGENARSKADTFMNRGAEKARHRIRVISEIRGQNGLSISSRHNPRLTWLKEPARQPTPSAARNRFRIDAQTESTSRL